MRFELIDGSTAGLIDGSTAGALVEPEAPPARERTNLRTVFLVRTCSLDSLKIQRLRRWQQDLQAHSWGTSFWVQCDVSPRCNCGNAHTLGFQSFNYSSATMESAYPALRAIPPCVPQERGLARPWVYHAETLGLFHSAAMRSALKKYDYLWVFEDDADYTGRVSALIKSYKSVSADLLSQPLGIDVLQNYDITRPVPNYWLWVNCTTPAFQEAVRPTERRAAAEHVQRLSHRLLDYIHKSSSAGLVAHSELSIPSLCRRGGFTWRSFRRKHVGRPFTFYARLTPEEFARAPRGKLYHGIKAGDAGRHQGDVIQQAAVPESAS